MRQSSPRLLGGQSPTNFFSWGSSAPTEKKQGIDRQSAAVDRKTSILPRDRAPGVECKNNLRDRPLPPPPAIPAPAHPPPRTPPGLSIANLTNTTEPTSENIRITIFFFLLQTKKDRNRHSLHVEKKEKIKKTPHPISPNLLHTSLSLSSPKNTQENLLHTTTGILRPPMGYQSEHHTKGQKVTNRRHL